MADAPAAQEKEDGPPYPTYNERKAQDGKGTIFRGPYERLIWPIRGEFPSAFSVMKVRQHIASGLEPLFNKDIGEWHEIAMQSITDKKISFVEASLQTLNEWDANWRRSHIDHAEHGDGDCESVPYDDLVAYGDLSKDVRPFVREQERENGTWFWDETSNKEILIRCCGENRPLDKKGLRVEVRPSPGNDFITVKDYVGTVYCWLLSMRDDIEAALHLAEPGYPLNTEWRLLNTYRAAPDHEIQIPEAWNSLNDGSWMKIAAFIRSDEHRAARNGGTLDLESWLRRNP